MARVIFNDLGLSLFVAGAVFGDLGPLLLLTGAIFYDLGLPLVMATLCDLAGHFKMR